MTPRALSALSGGYLGNVMGTQQVLYAHARESGATAATATAALFLHERVRKSSSRRTQQQTQQHATGTSGAGGSGSGGSRCSASVRGISGGTAAGGGSGNLVSKVVLPVSNASVARIQVYDVAALMAVNRDLAENYVIDSKNAPAMCRHNAAVADRFGFGHVAQCWRLAELMAVSTGELETDDDMFFNQIPFPKNCLEKM